MNCSNCGKEVVEIQAPIITAQEVMKAESMFPIKLICSVSRVYGCKDCNIKIIQTETKDYKICNCKPILDEDIKELEEKEKDWQQEDFGKRNEK